MLTDTLSTATCTHALHGRLTPPGDKSISHRAALLAGLAHGTTCIRNFLCSSDCLHTLTAMQQLGTVVEPAPEPAAFTVTGTGMQPTAPSQPIDCGNAGTGMRLLAGVLAGFPFRSTLCGDASLSARPMDRIIIPLAGMGACITAHGKTPGCAPLEITGTHLHATDYTLPIASAQVKSALLLAGLHAGGITTVHQPYITRDHTERLFRHFSLPCRTSADGLTVSTIGPAAPHAKDLTIPGDISAAAFWMVAASLVPGSRITLLRVGLNPSRAGVIRVLRRMGADISIANITETCEPCGDITVCYAPLCGTELHRDEVPNVIDEIPILAIAAAYARGTTLIRRAAELRVKESDRIAAIVGNLRAMGAQVAEYDDGMAICGGQELTGCTLESYGDHRIAMSFLVAGLRATGQTTLLHCKNIDTSYPGFADDLRALTD